MFVSWLLALLLLLSAPHHPHGHQFGKTRHAGERVSRQNLPKAAPAPAFVDCQPYAGNAYTIPTDLGVIYSVMVNGGVFRATTAGTYPAPLGARVEVEALTGAPEAPDTRQLGDWVHTFGLC